MVSDATKAKTRSSAYRKHVQPFVESDPELETGTSIRVAPPKVRWVGAIAHAPSSP